MKLNTSLCQAGLCFRTLASLAALGLAATLAACGAPTQTNAPTSNLNTVIGKIPDGNSEVSFSAPTRILLVGYSHGMGTQFVETAKAAALRYRASGWNEQVVFIASPEVGASTSDKAALERYGIRVVFDDPNTHFGSGWMLRYLKNYEKIVSLEFFGHSSVQGIGLEEGEARLGTDTSASALANLKGRFSSDAFVALHGCNAGGKLAPFLSAAWNVPVSAALTGTNFQRLHSNGKWYFNDPGLFPSGGWAAENAMSHATRVSCKEGACLRMKPSNSSYRGYWGTYEGGLGFYKTFCAKTVGNSTCARGAAQALLAFPSTRPLTVASTWADFQETALDFLCPNTSDDVRRKACFAALPQAAGAGGSGVYSPFRGTTLKCTLRECEFEDVCQTDAEGNSIPGTCSRKSAANPNPKEYVEELRLLAAGFASLKGEASRLPAPTFP
jgi:hypothetical protein